jgi:hypothetical protein
MGYPVAGDEVAMSIVQFVPNQRETAQFAALPALSMPRLIGIGGGAICLIRILLTIDS